jgi:hypothetical protein
MAGMIGPRRHENNREVPDLARVVPYLVSGIPLHSPVFDMEVIVGNDFLRQMFGA